MSTHCGFSNSDNESANSVDYACSDPDHCDKGVDCDGDHMYSHETAGLKGGQAHFFESANKSEATVDKSEVEYNDPPSPPVSDQVKVFPIIVQDPWNDESDDSSAEADTKDACSHS